MKYRVLATIRIKTSKGETDLHPGQVIALQNDIAIRLINDGRIDPVGKIAYKIHSKILGDDLWIVDTEKELQGMVDEGVTETIYTQKEVSMMIDEGVSKDGLVAIHKVKNDFSGSGIEDIYKIKKPH